jgi:tetratricopeptide (TPR) repeat protein
MEDQHPTANGWYSNLLAYVGRFDDALRQAKLACELEPISPTVNGMTAWTLYMAGRHDQAISQCDTALVIDASYLVPYWVAALAYKAKQEYNEAFALLKKGAVNSRRTPFFVSLLGHLYGLTGQQEKAIEFLAELEQRSANEYVPPLHFAWIHLGIGNTDAAIQFLRQACEERNTFFFNFRDPMTTQVVGDPRFNEILRDMGLSE